MGQPDNDFLLYLPVYDMWYEQDGLLLMFDIHSMKKRAPRFIEAVNRMINEGYGVDYISDNFIRSLETEGGVYQVSKTRNILRILFRKYNGSSFFG